MRNPIKTSLVLALLAAPTALAQDKIKDNFSTKSGKKIRAVEITAMTATAIKYVRDGSEDELPSALLDEVEWFQPPEQLALAHAAMRKGEFDNAANLFEEAAGNAERAVLKAEAAFFAAQAVARSAADDANAAGTAVLKLESFLSENGDHYRAAEAQLELGRVQMISGDAQSAEQTLTELSSKVISQGLDQLWDIRAKYEIAEAQLAQDKFAEARTSFRRAKTAANTVVAAATGPVPEIKSYIARAVVGEGETFIREGKFDEGIRYFDRFQKDKDLSIAAAAKAGKGESLFLKAEAEKSDKDLRAAQIVLAEAVLDDIGDGSTTAKSLYYLGRVIMALGSERESTDYAQRATTYYNTVIKHYPATPWARKAKEQTN